MVHIIKGWTFSKLVSELVVTMRDIDRNQNCCLVSQVKLSEEAQNQMRKLLKQKETNHLRLKRAKMNRSMFDVIKKLGIGAFGEVSLVRKRVIDPEEHGGNQLYAMKTLRKVCMFR